MSIVKTLINFCVCPSFCAYDVTLDALLLKLQADSNLCEGVSVEDHDTRHAFLLLLIVADFQLLGRAELGRGDQLIIFGDYLSKLSVLFIELE